jgi:hypothetical protein
MWLLIRPPGVTVKTVALGMSWPPTMEPVGHEVGTSEEA